jgi:hypothetical protein
MAGKAKKRASAVRRGARTARVRAARPKPIGAPRRPTTPADTYTSKPVEIAFAGPNHRFNSADLEILGVYHGEASYEGRIFFNNPKANAATPRTLDNGYAGSFYVFGHGGCFGDVGHCAINGRRDEYDLRYSHPLTPINKRITVTSALKYYARSNGKITITVVPIVSAANALCDTKKVFRFQEMRFLTYNP